MTGGSRWGLAAVLWLLPAVSCQSSKPPVAPRDGGTLTSCRDDSPCAADEYCAHDLGLCGRGSKPGACMRRSAPCEGSLAPVCGCDGKVYASECVAHAGGIDLATLGGCDAPVPDWAPCGAHYCDAHTSYCEIYLSDVLEPPTDHFCRPLPKSCLPDGGVAPTCDCFSARTPCRAFCGPLPTGGLTAFHLTCQGVRPPPDRARP